MELNHLKYFHEVARCGSFTQASRALRVSQPAISKIIRQLEENEGITLFERGRRGVSLTPTGRAFFERCEAIFEEVGNLRTEIERSRHEVSGELAVGASDNLCNYVLPPLFADLWVKYPKVQVKLFNGAAEAIQNEIVSRRSEIGLFFTPVRERLLASERLAFIEFWMVCSPENTQLRSGKFRPELLEKFYFIGSRREDYSQPFPALKMLHSLGIRPNQFFETNSQETQKRMAMNRYGYTVLPRYMVENEIRSGELRRIQTPVPVGSDLYLVRRAERALSRPASVFIDEVRSLFKGQMERPRSK